MFKISKPTRISSAGLPASLLGISLLLCFSFYPLCYTVVLLKFTYYAQYYAQEQELLSDYYAIYMLSCMSSSLHVAHNFYLLMQRP